MKIMKIYDDGSGSGVGNSGDGDGINLLACLFSLVTVAYFLKLIRVSWF